MIHCPKCEARGYTPEHVANAGGRCTNCGHNLTAENHAKPADKPKGKRPPRRKLVS